MYNVCIIYSLHVHVHVHVYSNHREIGDVLEKILMMKEIVADTLLQVEVETGVLHRINE